MNELLVLAAAATTLVVVIAAAILIFIASRRTRPLLRARHQAIAALCSQRGLTAAAGPDDFVLLGVAERGWLTNAHASPDGGVAIADFTRPAGESASYFSILGFTVAGVNVPYLAVVRRDLTAITIGGAPELQLESIEFDKRFSVKARDRRSATMLLDQAVMQLLLDCGDVNFDMLGDRVVAYVNRMNEPAHLPAEPVEFQQLFRFMDAFLAGIPPLLRTEYAAAP